MHPIALLQMALVDALGADAALTTLIGAGGVFDARRAAVRPRMW